MNAGDVPQLLTILAVALTVAILVSVRQGNAPGRAQAAVALLILGDLALTLAGQAATWPTLFEVAAPTSLAGAIAAVFLAAERPCEATAESEWTSFERQFRAYVRSSRTTFDA
jgi:hypothetical protein